MASRHDGASLSSLTLTRAAWATRLQFLALGIIVGTWGAHIPSLKTHYALGEGALSVVLFAVAAGTVSSLFIAGRAVGRYGARAVAGAASVIACTMLALALQHPNLGTLLVAMLLFGAMASLFDVAINAEGAEIEATGGRAVMSNLHAMFSVGGMVGAGAAAWMFSRGVAPRAQLLGVCAAVAVLAVVASRGMLAKPATAIGASAQAHFAWPRGRLVVIGVLIFAGMTAEGVMYDWSVLYLKQEVGMPQSRAALGYATFCAAMALSRFGGDALRARYPERAVLRVGAYIAAAAMTAVLLSRVGWTAFVGFALVGAGLAPVAPILFNAATRLPGISRAAAIASVTSVGYSGFMLGPPLIGGIATATSLSVALGVVVLAAVVLGIGARHVPARDGEVGN